MNSTVNQDRFIDIFKNNLKKDARTVSVATLLSARYLKRIDFDPYYQRNYVWQKDKQSFFIESVILGTEIPPLVFYKSGMNVEVIDGRQRFETLKRFKEDDFALNISGLLNLQALAKKSFSKLNADIQQLFLNTKIRIFEFEVVGIPAIDSSIEDRIKKEIFRRYNTGITPLNQTEVDNAKYDNDDLSDYFKTKLKKDKILFETINKYLFRNSKKNTNELIVDMVTFLRKVVVLNQIPISRYADTSERSIIIDLMYENFISNVLEDTINPFTYILDNIFEKIKLFTTILQVENIFIYECLIWGASILENEKISIDYKLHAVKIQEHYTLNKSKYNTENDHYYANVLARFKDTCTLLNSFVDFNFDIYINSGNFKNKLNNLKQTERQAEMSIDKLSSLRINKPSPASKPIDQITSDLKTNFYMIRPSYQRQEKIDIKKASSIIESILLGIKLPPIFIYVREDKVREVVDGQQRLLSILGFLGQPYINEDKVQTYSIHNNFELKGLRILKDLNGNKFSAIKDKFEDIILDFDIDEIEISHELNSNFEPTDLFIRLNSKPYPIKANSFEMWNSTVDMEVIQKIKKITSDHIDWFYVKAPDYFDNGQRCDRMQNEELITTLSYLCYDRIKNNPNDITKILGFYPRLEKFTCRLKNKTALTELLESFENKYTDKEFFLKSIDKTDEIIKILSVLLHNNPTKESFNQILNIKNIKHFSRTIQDLYIIWILLSEISIDFAITRKDEILKDINTMLSLLKNVDDEVVTDIYVTKFIGNLNKITDKYKHLQSIG